MRAAKEAGVRIPQNLALVGFDDIEFAKFVGLTTMRQPIAAMGRMAVTRLLKRIEGRENGDSHRELEAELIVRESCGSRHAFHIRTESDTESQQVCNSTYLTSCKGKS